MKPLEEMIHVPPPKEYELEILQFIKAHDERTNDKLSSKK
jgi:hypothetical protein